MILGGLPSIYNNQKVYSFMNQKHASISRQNLLFILAAFLIVIAIISAATRNISDPGVWLDESGQFWMSLGLNHFSTPGSAPSGLSDLIKNNADFNLDPGGFTLALRIWMRKFGYSVESLRSLPFTFFVANCILLIKICREIGIRREVSFLSPAILLINPLQIHYAFEIRPYSAEAAAWLLALYFSLLIPNILSESLLKMLSISSALAVALWLRYSVIIPIAVFLIMAAWGLCFKSDYCLKRKLSAATVLLTPILISCSLIYIITLRNQNTGGTPPAYVQNLMLKYTSFADIFLVKGALVLLAPWLLLVTFIITAKYFGRSARILPPKAGYYMVFSGLSSLVLFIFSMSGKYPFGFWSRWDIGINIVFSIALIVAISVFAEAIISQVKRKELILIICIVTLFYALPFRYSYSANDSVYNSLSQCRLKRDSGEPRKMLGNRNSLPTVKYLYEYGPMSSMKNEYKNFKWFYSASEPRTEQLVSAYQVDVDTLDFNDYEVVVLTHFDNKDTRNANLLERLDESHSLCDEPSPSMVYERKAGPLLR